MADQDVATKAPESDAVATSLIPGDTPAQSGASLGVCPFFEIQGIMLIFRRSIASQIDLPVSVESVLLSIAIADLLLLFSFRTRAIWGNDTNGRHRLLCLEAK